MSQLLKRNETRTDNRSVLFRLLDTLLDGSPSGDDLLSNLIRVYDNLRPSYSTNPKLEFGGIILDQHQIRCIVEEQVRSLFKVCSPRSLLLIWKNRTALQYMHLLKDMLTERYDCDVICRSIRTRWVSERNVILVDAPLISDAADLVLCADAFIGTGNTFSRLHDCITSNGLPTPTNLVLVDLAAVKKDYQPILHEPYVTVPEDFWIIGFNADCLADGIEHGRGIPFMGYLVPSGTGIRKEILERYSEQIDRLQETCTKTRVIKE